MGVNLSGRSFLKLLDLTTEEIEYLLKLSKNFKDMKRAGVPHRYLEGKNIVLLFQKTSTRTRCAFEVGGMDLGMGVTYLDPVRRRWARRSPSRTPPAFSVACMTASSSAALPRTTSRSSLPSPACPCGTA